VGLLLGVGIVLMPYLFAWFVLRKGYSLGARLAAFGWLAFLVITIGRSGGFAGQSATAPLAESPEQHERGVAAAVAKMEVPQFMKDPGSAQFGRVWGMGPNQACGFVNGKNSFGAMTGDQRFIFAAGSVEFEGGSPRFARHWNALCVDKLLTAAPPGVLGRRWGSRPGADLKLYAPTTDEGLSLYVPRHATAPFDGVPVADADLRFDHGRLYGGDLYVDGEANRDAIKAALAKRYGTPLESDDATHSYKWTWPQRHVAVSMSYDEAHKRSWVMFDREGAAS
jgi:hypothetical protein